MLGFEIVILLVFLNHKSVNRLKDPSNGYKTRRHLARYHHQRGIVKHSLCFCGTYKRSCDFKESHVLFLEIILISFPIIILYCQLAIAPNTITFNTRRHHYMCVWANVVICDYQMHATMLCKLIM